ncbi:GGDEF domain-containing phosphodiesterase [Marinomonas pontica]|uniref:GGDEF domain-containing phosphodiesterase n=1 Tax=Marinomonas pontica TaxID=264739 RepID=UPI002244078A|nr:GGDEF domain-containing phosphodiesterase [Marinomonas pontica]MCW8357067.1 GGDEF domain-containing phosphodiesterase [Marinomonas pontica]
MFIDFLKKYFFVDSHSSFGEDEKTFQQSALRILLALTISIFAISELHSLLTQSDLVLLGANSVYLVLLVGLLALSHRHTKVSAVLFLTALVTTSFLLLTLSNEPYAEKYALVSLYSLPLITRLLFSFKASLAAMAINIFPFCLMAINSSDFGQIDTSSFYFQLLTFVTLNIGLPLAVSKIIQTLENNASHMKLLYKKLNNNYAMYEEFFENTGTPTLLCDQRGKILKANQLARDLLTDSGQHNFTDSRIVDWLTPANDTKGLFWQSNLAECTLKQRAEVHIQIRRVALNQHGHYALHLQNNTQLHAIQQELESTQETNNRLARLDLLTLLPNHRHFCCQINQRIAEQDQHLTGAMFIIRISQFKLLNKQYGKDSANKVILNFSKTLQKKLSEQAIIGRLRGVKFACFVPLGQTYLIQKNLSTLIRSVLPSQVTVDGSRLNMDYQVGIAYYHTDGKSAEELLEHCEMALEYSTSTDRFSYYNHSLENKLIEEHKLGLKLSSAIKNKEIKIWLQPQVSPNGQICSFEALARWQNNGTFVPPTSFIKIAEKLGLLPLLAENLVRELVATLTVWHEEHIYTPIAFNLAGQELMNDAFFALLMSLIADNPWLASMLELEITETSPVMTHPLIHKRLRSLSQYGYSIAIDDFGTGQASLGQLIDIPANILKIDRRFVSPLPEDQRHIDIVKSTIQLADSLGMKVIAEGIETKEQANLLTALGCQTLQGYYFGKPSPLTDWTAKDNAKAKELRMVY